MYLCCEGDEVEIAYTDRFAEVLRVIPRNREYYDSHSIITPTCFACRSKLRTDGSDIRCTNINCIGTEKGRVDRMLRMYSQHRYGPCHEEDVIAEISALVMMDAVSLDRMLSFAVVGSSETFPMLADMFTKYGAINRDAYHDEQIGRNDRLAVLIDGLAIPGLSAMDCVNIVQDITDNPPFNYYEEIWNILSTEHAIEDVLDINPNLAAEIVDHVHRRRNRRGSNSIQSILHTLSQL